MGTRLTHWALPLAAAALPWRAGFALLARAAATDRARHAYEAQAFASAQRFVASPGGTAVLERDAWIRAWRLVQLVDNADLFLSMTRGTRWLERNFEVTGAWPARGPFLALSAHWGAGLWALRHLRGAGHRARFLSLRIDRDALAADRAYLAYVRARIHGVEHACGAPVIYTGGAAAEIDAAWKSGISVIALCDAPPAPGRSTIAAHAGGLTLTMQVGLIRLACERRIPVVPFFAGIDCSTGRRRIDIEPARIYVEPQSMADALAARVAALVTSDSAAWHMWPHATQLLPAPAPAHADVDS